MKTKTSTTLKGAFAAVLFTLSTGLGNTLKAQPCLTTFNILNNKTQPVSISYEVLDGSCATIAIGTGVIISGSSNYSIPITAAAADVYVVVNNVAGNMAVPNASVYGGSICSGGAGNPFESGTTIGAGTGWSILWICTGATIN